MRDQGALHLHGAEAVTADVEHVVDAAHDPEVSVFIFAGAVSGEIHAGNLGPVILHVAVGIAVNRAQHSGPRALDDEESAGAFWDGLAFPGHDLWDDAGEWPRGRAGLGRDCAWHGGRV